jgi:hypothetical protein
MPNYLKLWEGKRGADAYIKCMGIRGAVEKEHGNQIGIYDDLIVLLIGDATTEWKASTDPGQYYVKHPTDRHGCAQLTEGIWMYKVGLHRGKWPAFVQAEPFTINRLDQNGNIESVATGDFGIHLHSGGPGMDVGQFSAGCQVIWSPEGYFKKTWKMFFDPTVKAMLDRHQPLMPYMLVSEESLPSEV